MADTSTFVPPSWVENQDAGVIHQRMMDLLPEDIDDTEGGFPWDFTKPSALEKARLVEFELLEALKCMHYMFAYGIYLDYHAEAYGLSRRGSVAASGELTITGDPGTVIPAGFHFAVPAQGEAAAIIFRTHEEATIDEVGTATVTVTCTETGKIGNVAADTIVIMVYPIVGVRSITNETALTGGAEEEDDDTLRERIREYLKTINVSFAGCDSDYKRWSMELDDVGSVRVMPEWDGPGTVKVVVLDRNGEPANSVIIENVLNHIVSPGNRDNRLAPIGATVTVVAPTLKDITISCNLTLENEADPAGVLAALTEAITNYIHSGLPTIKIAKIGSLILGTEGVADYNTLKINGDTENVDVNVDEYPVLTSLSL